MEALLARRIDALADNIELAVFRDTPRRCYALAFFSYRTICRPRCDCRCKRADKIGGCAAAAPHDKSTALRKHRHLTPEVLCRHLVRTRARIGEARVRLDNDRQIRPLHQLVHDRHKLHRSERAVDTKRRDTKGIERNRDRRDGCAEEGAPILLECHRHPDRQLGMFLRCEHRCLDLVEVGQRLKDDEIRPGLLARGHHLTKELVCSLKRERSKRLDQFPDRTDIECDTHSLRAGVLGCAARRADVLPNDLGDRLARSLELMRIRAEGVAVDDTAARCDVIPMNLFDHIRMRESKKLGTFPRRKSTRLQLGAHASVQNDNIVHFPIFSHLFSRLCPFAASASRLAERAGAEHETVLTVRRAMRLWCACNPHDRRHRFARHHDRRRRQRDTDAPRHIEQCKEFRLLRNRQIAVAGTEAIRKIAPLCLHGPAHITLEIVADILDRRTRTRIHDDRVRRIDDFTAHHQTLDAGAEGRTKEHNLLTRLKHSWDIISCKRHAEHSPIVKRSEPIRQAGGRRRQHLIAAATNLCRNLLRQLLSAKAEIL